MMTVDILLSVLVLIIIALLVVIGVISLEHSRTKSELALTQEALDMALMRANQWEAAAHELEKDSPEW